MIRHEAKDPVRVAYVSIEQTTSSGGPIHHLRELQGAMRWGIPVLEKKSPESEPKSESGPPEIARDSSEGSPKFL